jgi:serine protease inhibitor
VPYAPRPTRCQGEIMERMSVERRLLLKAAAGAVFGLINGASLADILQAGSGPDAGNPARDGLAAAQSRLADSLLHILADEGKAGAGGNLIVSPASLASILSFVDLGANNAMRAAIHQTLGFKRASRRGIEQDLSSLRDSVSAIIARSGADGPIALANLLAFDLSTRPRQVALIGLSGTGADVLVDHLSDAKVVERINGWVRQKTHELIPSIIEEAPEELGLTAINALYFRDRWKEPFDPARTKPEPFQMLSGKPVDVDMMHAPDTKFGFRQDERFIAAELAYARDDFKLVLVTTKSAPARAADFSAVASWLGGEGFAPASGEIGVPKMSLSATQELLRPLDTLGLADVRRMPDALNGFSAMPLMIARVIQKLDLRLDEDGTEAAAATAVMSTRSLGTKDRIRMILDKPFLFALRDRKTGFILFTGYVAKPATLSKTSLRQ